MAFVKPLSIMAILMHASFAAADSHMPTPPEGVFEVVALRAASDVHSAAPVENAHSDMLGQKISLGENCVWFDEIACTNTHFVLPIVELVNANDPNLSDVMLIPEGLAIDESNLKLSAYAVNFSDGTGSTFLHVDSRIIIVPIANGSINAILAKPLTASEIQTVQTVLRDLGVYEGQISGAMDQSITVAIANIADQLGAEYRFIDPVVSENLLTWFNNHASNL